MIRFFTAACAVFRPPPRQPQTVFGPDTGPVLRTGQTVKVISWNVQYMAGKNYVFFYDLPDGCGPDKRPSKADIEATLRAAARIIREEDPDIVLLQEVDDNARRTDFEDQLEQLLNLLPPDYKFHASAFYWKSPFVPHPKIMGAVGLKLSVVSKYKIALALRHQLPLEDAGVVRRMFHLKRAVLETRLPVENDRDFVVMNTHLSAFVRKPDTMERQVEAVKSLIDRLAGQGERWVVGGDFNLLPDDGAYARLPDRQKACYRERTELGRLTAAYRSIPDPRATAGDRREQWYTFFPNDPRVRQPDRTIDYIFYSDRLQLGPHRVIQQEALAVSDHLPVVAEFTLV